MAYNVGTSNGGLVWISSQTASTSSSLTFILDAKFKKYLISYRGVTFTTGDDVLLLQLSSDGGSTFSTTNYSSGTTRISWNSSSFLNNNSTSGLILASQVSSSPMQAELYLSEVEILGLPTINGLASSTNQLQWVGGGYGGSALTTNAFKILTSMASTFSGYFALYGLFEP